MPLFTTVPVHVRIHFHGSVNHSLAATLPDDRQKLERERNAAATTPIHCINLGPDVCVGYLIHSI
jgi:hypothetical protein